MDDKFVRLRAHERNIDRYQRLLKTKLNDVETQFLERRLSEERFWLTMLGGSESRTVECPRPYGRWNRASHAMRAAVFDPQP